MASNDRVGALYYEVILDPRGFARGASIVKQEQNVLVRAVQSTVSEQDRIKAELIAVAKQMRIATGDELKLLIKYKRQLVEQHNDISKAIVAENRAKRQEMRDERKRQQFTTAANIKRIKEIKSLRDATYAYRMMKLSLSKSIKLTNAGLSKMAGNAMQALGFGPAAQGLVRTMGMLGIKVLAVSVALVALAAVAIKSVLVFDKYLIQMQKLESLFQGSTVAARSIAVEMENFANKTSFTTTQLIEFATQMRNLGARRAEIEGLAKTLGVLSFGDPEKLKLIGKAYTDVMAKGKLMAQEANQLANAGVPVWQALSKHLNKSVSDIREMAINGEITAATLKTALELQAERIGGTQLLINRLKTMAGQWDVMKNTVSRIARMIGDILHPLFVGIMVTINGILAGLEGFVTLLKLAYYVATGQLEKAFETIAEKIDGINTLAYDMAEALEDTNRIIAEQNVQAKEQYQTYQDLLDAVKDRFRSEEELAEMAYKRKMDEKVIEEEITQEQADQLIIAERAARLQEREQKAALENLNTLRDKREAAEKEERDKQKRYNDWYEDLQRNARNEFEEKVEKAREMRDSATKVIVDDYRKEMKKIDSDLQDKLKMMKAADAGGASFEAGSKEEANFLREMEMQARRDAMQTKWETEAAQQRKDANMHMRSMVSDLGKLAKSQVGELEKDYGLQAP